MTQRILIIEDEVNMARFIELELKHEGYETDKAYDGMEGLNKALSGCFSLVILDVMLPVINGLEVLRRVRKESQIPIILLTARDAVMDKVSGLDAGADDYMTKPFAIEELLARIRVALKKTLSRDENNMHLCIKGVSLDIQSREVRVCGNTVELTRREFDLLACLMRNRNIVMSRDRLMDEVCGYGFSGETNMIDVYVRYLRSKIDVRYDIRLISTVRGAGYVIKDDSDYEQ